MPIIDKTREFKQWLVDNDYMNEYKDEFNFQHPELKGKVGCIADYLRNYDPEMYIQSSGIINWYASNKANIFWSRMNDNWIAYLKGEKESTVCLHRRRYKNIISRNLAFWSCSDCGADLGNIPDSELGWYQCEK